VYYVSLAAGADPIVAYDGRVLEGGFDTAYPVVKLMLGNRSEESVSYPYKYFQAMQVVSLKITAGATGIRTLILENDLGRLDPAKPFYPFGPQPKVGSSFLVGSHEVFQKPLSMLQVDLVWADLPSDVWATHYSGYGDGISNSIFTGDLSLLKDGGWELLAPGPLFDAYDKDELEIAPKPERSVPIPFANALKRHPDMESFDRFHPGLQQGFLQVTLKHHFFHRLYTKLLAAAAGDVIPNQPYTPLIASLTLGYTAILKPDDLDRRFEQLFQIGPFGHRQVLPTEDEANAAQLKLNLKLIPEFLVNGDSADDPPEVAEGSLLIGLDGLQPPQNLSLLIQVAEGSEDPLSETQPVIWSYLADDEWVKFEPAEILADATNGLLESGVIKLAMPKRMTPARTLLPAGRHWIKASVAHTTRAVPRLVAIHPQAVVASFRDQNNDPQHLARPLPAETIGKLRQRQAAIKTVCQPYASFAGRMAEPDQQLMTRVSERLRHKGRALTIYDYERLVLESFPEVYKVRCINHTRGPLNNQTECEHAPGYIRLVVVPDLRNRNAVDPLKPRLSIGQRRRIRSYLAGLASEMVTIEVENPDYEEIQVGFNVILQPGRDQGHYTGLLEQEIIGFLSPWLYDDAADLTFGGLIQRSSILNFIDERPYVDYVTDLRMDQIIDGITHSNLEQAEATSSSSALVSAGSHSITALLPEQIEA
jgi:hypothetical protein